MIFGSVCSGIEAASVAWKPLGIEPSWLAEIEKFPSAVLEHHYPDIPNLGDMTKLSGMVKSKFIAAPDIFVGGTPCQAFSIAGLRNSLEDDRGQLTLEFVRLANAIDTRRILDGRDESIILWENVPGVLNTKDNAFGCFLAALAGEDEELQSPGKRWTNAGIVSGPQRTVAWRVLDAQYFGVAQRRRRVFVVGSARDDINPAEILFEFEGMRRDSAPSREARKEVAGNAKSGVRNTISTMSDPVGTLCARDYKGVGNQFFQEGKVIAQAYQEVSHCLNAGGMGRQDYETESFVVHGKQDPCFSKATAFALGRNNGGENIVCHPIHDKATRHAGATGRGSGNGLGVGSAFDPSPTLTAGDKHAVAFQQNANANAICFEPRSPDGHARIIGDICPTLNTMGGGQREPCIYNSFMQIRKLTPVECERLQGFPDNYTLLPYGVKQKIDSEVKCYYENHLGRGLNESEYRSFCGDGPRYKALGNSMAVPVMRWIGERIKRAMEND